MCGICGFLGLDDSPLLNRMMTVLSHRGPDDSGTYADAGVGLGHRRLSIIDLGASGRQPIHNEDETIWVTYNGEIYNFIQLRHELEGFGHRFSTNTDTEVIVHGYEQWGVDCVKHFNGIFAFALWDSVKKRLFLSRDRLGVKPLFYAHIDGVFFFASEIKAILEYQGYKPAIDYNVLNNFLGFSYCNTFDKTLFDGIYKLPAAHNLLVEPKGGKINPKRYWSLKAAPENRSEEYFSKLLLEHLRRSIKMQLVSDVPLGVYLSGGLDSSSIVALMADMTDDIKTFSVGFGDYGESELENCKIVSEKFHTDHHELVVEPDTVNLLPKMIWYSDEPLVDFAMIPLYLLSLEAKKDVTVVLTGEGGDETQGGYEHFISHMKLKKKGRHFPGLIAQPARSIVGLLPSSELKNNLDYGLRLWQDSNQYALYTRYFREDEKEMIYTPELSKKIKPISYDQIMPPDVQIGGMDFLDGMMLADINTILVNSYLVKTDRATMAASIEARVPLLDHQLVEFMFTVPPQYKLKGTTTKYLFRKTVKDILPREIINLPKKGFGVPVASWLKANKGYVSSILDEASIKKRGYFKNKYIQKVLSNIDRLNNKQAHRIWDLVTLELWSRIYLDGERVR